MMEIAPSGVIEVLRLQEPSTKPARWATLMTRPMFSPSRRPYVPPPEPEPILPPEPEIFDEPEPFPEPEPDFVEEPAPPPPPPPPPPQLALSMRGVMITPSKRMALFIDTNMNGEISLAVGDVVREWRLVEIGPRRSVFVHGETRRELTLPQPKD